MEELKETAASEMEKQETTQKTTNRKPLIRVVCYVAAIVLILVLTNPTVIPFMPESLKEPLQSFFTGIFGETEGVASVIKLNVGALLQLAFMVVIMLLVREISNWVMKVYTPKNARAATMKNLAASAMKYILAFVTVFWGLTIIGVDVSTLFASVGVVALIIGFGAESLIADVITGLFMIFENQYNVGDIIELGGYRGTVVNIAIRTTSVEDGGGNIKIFNNSDVRNIINLSADSSRAVCDIPIPYEADIDEAEKVIEELCQELVSEYPEVFSKPPVCAGVQSLADSAVLIRVVAQTDEEDRFHAARLINKKMKTGLEKAGMGAPYAQVVVHKAQ